MSMPWQSLRRWWARVRGVEDAAELDEETRFHIEMQTARNIERGLAPAEARRVALTAFGSLDRVKEEVRDGDPTHLVADLRQDLRYGVRSLAKSPASSLSAIAALMLGIGLTTLMFSIVYGAILRGLPFEEEDRLFHISRAELMPWGEPMRPKVAEFGEWRAQQKTFEDLAAFRRDAITVRYGEHADRVEAAYVTSGLFELLRVRPAMGRSIDARDDAPGAPGVALISHAVWQNTFAGDRNIVGRVIHASGEPATIIGVMPERFAFPNDQHMWMPMRLDPLRESSEQHAEVDVVGRLPRGVELTRAEADVNAIAVRYSMDHPPGVEGQDPGAAVRPLMEALVPHRIVAMMFTMLGAVFMVLLIACANVANILISRGVLRGREIGVRTALGASRFRIIRQFLTEAGLLAAAGALLGIAVASVGIRLFNNAIASTSPPFWIDIGVHGGVLAFVFVATVVAALLGGSIPAWQAARNDVNAVLKDGTRAGTSFKLGRLSRGLVVFEIALSTGLLVGAGLMIKSVINLRNVDTGFATRDVFTGTVTLAEREYPYGPARHRFYDELLAGVRQVPGVRAASLTTGLPGLGGSEIRYMREGRTYADERDWGRAAFAAVTPGYLETFDAQLIAGRMFTSQDIDGTERVALVNEGFARREFPAGDALGKRVRMGGPESPWCTIVGVMPDLYLAGLSDPDVPTLFVPLAQSGPETIIIAARVKGDPLAVTPAIRSAVTSLSPDVPVYMVATLDQGLESANWFIWVFGGLFSVFGITALCLAAIGLYGVMATAVRQRTREIGVRMALGARRFDVLRLVLGQGLLQLAFGVVGGLGFGVFLSRMLAMLLFRVEPGDPVTFVTIVGVMTATALLASVLPASRAARVHPLEALRND